MEIIRKIYFFIKKIQFSFDSLVTKFNLRIRGIKYGSIHAHGIPFIMGRGIIIGNNLLINSTLKSNPVGYAHKSVLIAYRGAKLIIGDNVGMSHVTIVAANEIYIDDGVMIGGGVNIYDTDFHSIDYHVRGTADDLKYAISKPIHICKNVFLGTQSTILKGVTIGENSIIGACSLVTKDIPENEVWAGVPAVFIKKLNY